MDEQDLRSEIGTILLPCETTVLSSASVQSLPVGHPVCTL